MQKNYLDPGSTWKLEVNTEHLFKLAKVSEVSKHSDDRGQESQCTKTTVEGDIMNKKRA